MKIKLAYIFVIIFLLGGMLYYALFTPKALPASEAKDYNCMLEYGFWKCINNQLVIPFYNSSSRAITFARVSVPLKHGTNIYNVSEPLESFKTATLTTASCNAIADLNKNPMELFWCCNDDCFATKMSSPSDKIKVKVKGS